MVRAIDLNTLAGNDACSVVDDPAHHVSQEGMGRAVKTATSHHEYQVLTRFVLRRMHSGVLLIDSEADLVSIW